MQKVYEHYSTSISHIEEVCCVIMSQLEQKTQDWKKEKSASVESNLKDRSRDIKLALAHFCNAMMFIEARKIELFAEFKVLLSQVEVGEELSRLHTG